MPRFRRPALILAVTEQDRAARLERADDRPTDITRVLHLGDASAIRSFEELAGAPRAVVVLADDSTPRVNEVVRLCWAANERVIPVILVRFGTRLERVAWPLHPANAVVDVAEGDAAFVEELLRQCLLGARVRMLPIHRREHADVVLVSGDPRPHAFSAALEHKEIAEQVLRPWPGRAPGEHGEVALWLRPRDHRPDTTERHALERVALPHDPRRYGPEVTPLDDAHLCARAIANLHVGHGDWSATCKMAMACAMSAPHRRARLLHLLGAMLLEPRACSWAGLVSLAREAERAERGRLELPAPPWVTEAKGDAHDDEGDDDEQAGSGVVPRPVES